MKTLILIACVMAVAGVVKTLIASDEQQEPNVWGPEAGGCRLSVTTDVESYRIGQPIRLRITLENVSERSVKVVHSHLMADYRFDVLLPDGKKAPLTLEGERQNRMPFFGRSLVALEPRQAENANVSMLNRLYDMTLLGEYSVTVYRNIMPEGDNAKPIEVVSNTLKIIIHDDDKDPNDKENDPKVQPPRAAPAKS